MIKMNEEEYELYEMQQRKKDMAAKYARPNKCEHLDYEFVEQENEINMTCNCNCLESTDKWRCMACGIIGVTININHICKVNWSEEE
jgi:hypothetical protein